MHIKTQGLVKKLVIGFVCISLLLYIIFGLFRVQITVEKSSITNMLFAIITIAGIGFGLAFSNYEIEELKEKKAHIESNEKISAKLKDGLILDINFKIKDTKPIAIFHGWLYVIITIILALAIVLNEIFKSDRFMVCLKFIGLDILCLLSYALLLLCLEKRHLINLATSGYDKSLEQIQEIIEGDYTKLLPK